MKSQKDNTRQTASDFWQHKGGQFNWNLSSDNVSLSCALLEIDAIIWPKISGKPVSGG